MVSFEHIRDYCKLQKMLFRVLFMIVSFLPTEICYAVSNPLSALGCRTHFLSLLLQFYSCRTAVSKVMSVTTVYY